MVPLNQKGDNTMLRSVVSAPVLLGLCALLGLCGRLPALERTLRRTTPASGNRRESARKWASYRTHRQIVGIAENSRLRTAERRWHRTAPGQLEKRALRLTGTPRRRILPSYRVDVFGSLVMQRRPSACEIVERVCTSTMTDRPALVNVLGARRGGLWGNRLCRGPITMIARESVDKKQGEAVLYGPSSGSL